MVVCNSHQINGEDVGSLDLYFLGLFLMKFNCGEKSDIYNKFFMMLTLTYPMKG